MSTEHKDSGAVVFPLRRRNCRSGFPVTGEQKPAKRRGWATNGSHYGISAVVVLAWMTVGAWAGTVPHFGIHEVEFSASGRYRNPYTELTAEVALTEPDAKSTRAIPLFWDGGNTWKFRFSPNKTGTWSWVVRSSDAGLDGRTGNFAVTPSEQKGGIRPKAGFPHHFERQDGSPFWFVGETAWALYTDNASEKHDRAAAERYLDARASQGFNVVHSMLLSEAGWGNQGGPPFEDIGAEEINPGYWREVDHRLAYANRNGIICGLALAWGNKGRGERYAWNRFPSLEARQRYARYIAARYSAYGVYFLVSGEWHAAIRARKSSEDGVRREFIEIGDALHHADPHGRMIAIHPMTSHGSVREFNEARWMSFGDYQQNYRDLHQRMLMSRSFGKPMVNSEYGYFLRDQDGDGTPDKDNSTSLEAMRHATWDIAMSGGYVVTGFGTTYFGGNRDPGPFQLGAEKNRPWEQQIGLVRKLFEGIEYWKLEPHDELLKTAATRGADSTELKRTRPPKTTYWCLAEPGRQYVIYVRGLAESIALSVNGSPGNLKARQFNPRTGEFSEARVRVAGGCWVYQPPDREDWVLSLE